MKRLYILLFIAVFVVAAAPLSAFAQEYAQTNGGTASQSGAFTSGVIVGQTGITMPFTGTINYITVYPDITDPDFDTCQLTVGGTYGLDVRFMADGVTTPFGTPSAVYQSVPPHAPRSDGSCVYQYAAGTAYAVTTGDVVSMTWMQSYYTGVPLMGSATAVDSQYGRARVSTDASTWTGYDSNIQSLKFILSVDPPSPPGPDCGGVTCITSVTPPDDPTGSNALATSTTFAFGAEGFVAPDDFVEGMWLRITYQNNVSAATLAVGPLFSDAGNALCSALPNWLCPHAPDNYELSGTSDGEFLIPIEDSGIFTFSTTTDIQNIGRHTMRTSIFKPQPNMFGLETFDGNEFLSTTTQFTVATSSSYDLAIGSTVEAILELHDPNNPPSCYFDWTTPGEYITYIQKCALSLFSVAAENIAYTLQSAMGDLLSRAPWGYATRVFTIITDNTATTSLPSLAVAIPAGLPSAGTTFDFSPWEPTAAAVDKIDTTVVETIDGSPLDQFMFWWNLMWSLAFAFWLLRELYQAYEFGDFDFEHTNNDYKKNRTSAGLTVYKELGRAKANSYARRTQNMANRMTKRF